MLPPSGNRAVTDASCRDRLKSEYGIDCRVDRLNHVAARWPVVAPGQELSLPLSGLIRVTDTHNREALIFESEWVIRYTQDKNPGVEFRTHP